MSWRVAVAAWISLVMLPGLAASEQLLYGNEGNRMRRYDIDTIGSQLLEEIFVERAGGSVETPGAGAVDGRDINGQICFFSDASGRFIAGEDTDQPNPPAGWGIFDADGKQIGKLTATYKVPNPEPFGCAFNSQGILFTSSVGEQGFGGASGQLIMWFSPYTGYPGPLGAYPDTDEPSTNFCKLATDIGTAAAVVVDGDDNVYISSSSTTTVFKFAPPFPTGPDAAGGCSSGEGDDFPMADVVDRSVFVDSSPDNKLFTYSGLALAPGGNSMYVASVLSGRIGEYDLNGDFIDFVFDHELGAFELPKPFGNPQGITVGSDGTIYYADLDLQGALPNIGPGPNGKVWRVRYDDQNGNHVQDAGEQWLEPEIVRDGLAFPDGVGVAAGNLEQTQWRTYAGSAERLFFNPDESVVTNENVAGLAVRWTFPTGGAITGSPTVAAVDLPGEGLTRVAYFQSWDRTLYAVRVVDGSLVWSLPLDVQPGASFENAGSVHVEKLDNRDRVFVGGGEILYSVDAATGSEFWRFTAGTGCMDQLGEPPGLCGFGSERNQIESSPYVDDGKVFFGMDVNDVATGKGGFYAVDALDGRMEWYFDPQSGQSCVPDATDEVRSFDGYHTEEELGLPAGFFASRAGCDFPRDPNGCGNIWSSPAVDLETRTIFTASSNCDTEIDDEPGGTGLPFPMPPFDEAIFALDYEGTPLWRWRPREFDNDDLAFGAVPNLFTITVDIDQTPTEVPVVGVGSKDGTYYVLDRSGTNQVTGASWDDDPATHLPADLPYWSTNVVAGGNIGGIIATAAVDEASRRVYFTTAPGDGAVNGPPSPPQLPFVHGLDLDTGAIAFQNSGDAALASFGPTSAIPGVMFAGTVPLARLRYYETAGDTGTQLGQRFLGSFIGLASGAIAIDGTVLVGEGVGTRTQTGSSPGDLAADDPSDLAALCVPGTSGCAACDNGVDDDGDFLVDAASDTGCVSPADPSEVLGDLDYDGDVDETDRQVFFQAFGRQIGEPGFRDAADFDRDGVPSLVDYQTWQQALADFEAPPPACGLVGVEPLLAFGALWMVRRRSRRRAAARGLALLFAACLVALAAPQTASALSNVRVEPSAASAVIGETFQVDILADLTDPILGFGIDLDFDDAIITLDAPPAIGGDWVDVFAPDGDGLAGLAPGSGVSGNDVLLATLQFTAQALGLSNLILGITVNDLTEGFALDPTGFDTTQFTDGEVVVTPEPGTALLVLAGLAGFGLRSRSRP